MLISLHHTHRADAGQPESLVGDTWATRSSPGSRPLAAQARALKAFQRVRGWRPPPTCCARSGVCLGALSAAAWAPGRC